MRHMVESRDANPFDVAIMDIIMPDKSGIDGLREMRAMDPHISVIMLTGFASLESAQEALRLGATDYVVKPFELQEITEKTRRYAERSRAARRRDATVNELLTMSSRLQEELLKQERLARLGQKSSEFMHDLRNPLQIVCNYVELLMEVMQKSEGELLMDGQHPEAFEYLTIIRENATRCEELAKRWKGLRGGVRTKRELCRVGDVVRQLIRDLANIASESGGELLADPPGDDCHVLVDPVELFRAVQNLVTNALQAIPRNQGRVVVRCTQADGFVRIEVEDNGHGIPPDCLPKVFDRLFTTKPAHEGTGLGLCIVKEFAETAGGSVQIVNRPEGGVRATILLPAANPGRPPAGDKADSGAAA
jgi:signal transduction histidine kinase